METIQIVIDEELLRATDRAAEGAGCSRSEFVCEALRAHLKRLEVLAMEERDRLGYAARKPRPEEFGIWEAEAAWPAE
jgi:metal-responsive CopG/Arc/MetJ family transcriptional regulator